MTIHVSVTVRLTVSMTVSRSWELCCADSSWSNGVWLGGWRRLDSSHSRRVRWNGGIGWWQRDGFVVLSLDLVFILTVST